MLRPNPIVILMADDDEDDILLTQKALQKGKLLNTLYSVRDGEELLDYLLRRGAFTDEPAPRPGIILLDLNMPKKDGREALREIKAHAELKDIPIVIFSTSKAEEDIYRSYQLGVNSFITKPVTFEALIEVMQMLGKYWFEIVTLPPELKERTYGETADEDSVH
jgi:CheY-like chemotaxis protein